jgi:hypothetical protein
LNCVWCAKEGTCQDGNWFGPKGSESCHQWRWKQCVGKLFFISRTYLIFILAKQEYLFIAAAGLILLIVVFCCICICCCCCGKKKSKSHKVINHKTLQLQEENENLLKNPSKSANQRAEMMKKYGIKDRNNPEVLKLNA